MCRPYGDLRNSVRSSDLWAGGIIKDWCQMDQRHIWHPFTPTPHFGPRALITKAKGAYLYDESGRRWFDATSSWWCVTHGHCHPRLVDALTRQAAELDQMLFAPHAHPRALELASQLLGHLPPSLERVFFSDDGSTAVEAAIKMALQFWRLKGERRSQFVTLGLAYHGDTLGAAALGGIDLYHHDFGGALDRVQLPAPYCLRCPLEKTFPSCDIACGDSTAFGPSTAALVIEPLILGAGGMITYPKAYVEKVVKAARACGALVIFDEVFTGFGRTGTLFAMDHLLCKPDIVVLSKGLTAGMMPMGVTITTQDIFNVFCGEASRAFLHGHTFTANALGCAVALESLKIFAEEDVLVRNEKKSAIMSEHRLGFGSLACVAEVRHLGMVFALECVHPQSRQPLSTEILWTVASRLWERGIWIRPLHNVIYYVPPYCVTDEELGWLMKELWEALSAVSANA